MKEKSVKRPMIKANKRLYLIVALILLITTSFNLNAVTDQGVTEETKSIIEIPADYTCINCHTALTGGEKIEDLDPEVIRLYQPIVDWEQSVHREVGVFCVDCHGGDPKNEEFAKDEAKGFIGKPAKKDISKLCADCHSNPDLMKSTYSSTLRTDQVSLFEKSVHGKKVAEGDLDSATCVSCHSQHKILRKTDPNALNNRQNISETCASCHSDKKIFEPRNIRTDQFELYTKSWHYNKFLEGNNIVPTCFDCHSNHEITPAKSVTTQESCFSCHTESVNNLKSGPHWTSYKGDKNQPICKDCHGNHDLLKSSTEQFTGESSQDCVGCHTKNSPAYKAGLTIQASVTAATDAIDHSKEGIESLHSSHSGFVTLDLEKTTKQSEEDIIALASLTHSLNLEQIEAESKRIVEQNSAVSLKVDDYFNRSK
ncbi:MAG: ammonia-forming cytochrome c nitrite reductase subunit c552, partial [Nitrospinota bacterium]